MNKIKNKLSKHIQHKSKSNIVKKKEFYTSESNLSLTECKELLCKCEEEYIDSFKTGLCRVILSAYHALLDAKSKYYIISRKSKSAKNENQETSI